MLIHYLSYLNYFQIIRDQTVNLSNESGYYGKHESTMENKSISDGSIRVLEIFRRNMSEDFMYSCAKIPRILKFNNASKFLKRIEFIHASRNTNQISIKVSIVHVTTVRISEVEVCV